MLTTWWGQTPIFHYVKFRGLSPYLLPPAGFRYNSSQRRKPVFWDNHYMAGEYHVESI